MACASSEATGRPRPMPWRTSLVTNGRRIDAAVRLGDARARIADDDLARRPRASRRRPRPSPSAGVACRAFVTRFVTICRMRSPSPSTTGLRLRRARAGRRWRPRASSRCAPAARSQTASEVDLLDVEREAARLEAGEVEQVADQPLQAPGLREHDLERRLLLLLAVDHAVGDRLHVPLDRRQRRAQLVRDAHQEVALVLARLLQPARHLLEAQRELAELVGALRRQMHVVVAARDALARLRQLAHRARDAPAEQQRHERAPRRTASSSGGTTRRPCTSVEALIERTGRAITIAPISWPP